jgi:DNA polymerase-3 subunit beta
MARGSRTRARPAAADKKAAPLAPPSMTVESKALAAALATVGPALAKGDALPALTCAHVVIEGDTATISATDLDLGIVTTCSVTGAKEGQMLVPARLCEQLLREVGERTTLSLVRGKVKLTSGSFSALLPTYPVSESNIVAAPEGRSLEIEPKVLGDALLRVLPAASTEANRPMLQCVAVDIEGEFARFVATDSFRMAVVDTPLAGWSDRVLLLPGGFARLVAGAMARAERAVVTIDEDAVAVAVEDKVVVTKLYDREYVMYRRLMEYDGPVRVVVGRTDLLAAIRRARLVAGAKPVFLMVEGDELSIGAAGEAEASATEPLVAVVTGLDGPVRVPFNGRYLIDALATLGGDEVAIELTDDRKQVHLRPVGVAGVLHVLVPVRIGADTEVPDGMVDEAPDVGDEGAEGPATEPEVEADVEDDPDAVVELELDRGLVPEEAPEEITPDEAGEEMPPAAEGDESPVD